VVMYGVLKSVLFRFPNVSLSSLHRCVAGRLSVSIASQRTFAVRTDFSETVYDNEDGGPKCRGIELLRDPNFNKASAGDSALKSPHCHMVTVLIFQSVNIFY